MYPKIETLFRRGADFKVDTKQVRCPQFTAVDRWVVEEKCDGMNIQVHMMDPGYGLIEGAEQITREVIIQGRTPNANFRPGWMDYLKSIFTAPLAEALFKSELHPGHKVTLFGELMGPKINGNPHGLTELEFRGFDVLVNGVRWMERDRLNQVLHHFKIKGAPLVGSCQFAFAIIEWVQRKSFESMVSKNGYFEGVVCRPARELQTQKGDRLIWKLKTKDFA